MRARHPQPVPTHWLMTDERQGDGLWAAIDRLPRRSGIIVRHYSLPAAGRVALFQQVARRARAKQHIVIRAGTHKLGRREAGVHGRTARRVAGIRTWPAHNGAEIAAGIRAGAQIILVSPIFPTRSHPGAGALGPMRAAMMIPQLPAAGRTVRFIALGGMTARRFRRMQPLGFDGWAGIDGWARSVAQRGANT